MLVVLLTETDECVENDWVIRPIVNCLPAWFRFAQCLRRYRDTKEAFPHLVNAGKYSSTFLVVLFGTLRSLHDGENFYICLFNLQFCLICDTFITGRKMLCPSKSSIL